MKTLIPFLIVLSAGTLAIAQQEKPATEPPPVMEPQKLGPRTEPVDEKPYAKVLRAGPAGGADHATIAAALAAITDASENKRYAVLVCAGEYKGETVTMKPFVDLFGGFDQKDFKTRDIDANRTILDGENIRRVVIGADNARLDGFVIRNGKLRGPGAAVLCDHSSPTISNNTIINNATQQPEAVHKEMYHQHGNDGGAIACINGSNATITGNIIANNTTEIGNGGGVAAANWSMPHITGNVIVNNRTGLTDGKSRSSNGAGISASNALLRPPLRMTIVNNVIANNYAGGNSDAGGVYCEYDSSPLIGANWILANFAEDDGSAVYIMKLSQPLLVSNILAGHSRGALRLSKQGLADIENNLMFANGNAITSISAWMSLKNNTIVDNSSGVGHENSYAPYIKPPLITGNIIYGNGGGQLSAPNTGEDAPRVTNNDIQGGYPAGQGNFDTKPQFVDDGVKGQVVSLEYDPQRAATTLSAKGVSGSAGNLTGRVISAGAKWGVIKYAGDGKILVWGDLSPEQQKPQPQEFQIWPTYTLIEALAGNAGARRPAGEPGERP